MKDKTLMRASLAVSLTGIIALFILTNIIEIPEQKIIDAEEGDVRITGTIDQLRESKGIMFFSLHDNTGQIDAVLFDDSINLKKGQRVEVTGSVENYKGKKQIVADAVILK